MNDDPSSNGASRSWLDRLSHALTGEPRDREDLVELLRDAQKRNLLDADVLAMIEGALQVADMQVKDIMVPRAQMVTVPVQATPEEIIALIVESGHSRFPVVGSVPDEVIGILLAKNLLSYFHDNREGFELKQFVRPAAFIPESKRLNILLKEFRDSRNHMALVVDEYGGVVGLVTIEDVLEQIVGEIDDEHDTDEESWIQAMGERHYNVLALTPVNEFNEYFDTRLDSADYDTIGGYVTGELGRVPSRGEHIRVGELDFRVLRADNRRVHLLQLNIDGA
jgi:magnesium and cobalt transporter